MKSLYESILDDEDVLVGQTKKLANNWLLSLKFAMLNNDIEYMEKIINQDIVKNEISEIFYKFDGRMKWVCSKYSAPSNSFVYCMLKDTKERTKYPPKSVLSFILWGNNDYIHINVANIHDLTKTASNNVKPAELEKFKKYLLKLGAEYSKTGTGRIQNDALKI